MPRVPRCLVSATFLLRSGVESLRAGPRPDPSAVCAAFGMK